MTADFLFLKFSSSDKYATHCLLLVVKCVVFIAMQFGEARRKLQCNVVLKQ